MCSELNMASSVEISDLPANLAAMSLSISDIKKYTLDLKTSYSSCRFTIQSSMEALFVSALSMLSEVNVVGRIRVNMNAVSQYYFMIRKP